MRLLFTHISTALKQLAKNKGRSMLTMLGIIIGIGSVIFIMTTGEIAKNFLISQITQFGTNVVEVAPPGALGPFGESEELALSEKDLEVIEDSSLLPEVVAISGGDSSIETASYKDKRVSVSVMGDRPAVFDVNHFKIVKGRFFNSSDMNNHATVMVIGESLAEELYEDTDVVGKRLKVGEAFVRIVGVMEDFSFGPGSFGTPDFVFMPITSFRDTFRNSDQADEVGFLLVEFEPGTDSQSFANRLEYVINDLHGIEDTEEGAFIIVSREQALDIFNNILIAIQAFVSAVAAISLIVGGIGIMNIMLVTVKERTTEIGLRKAIGAKNNSVLAQFLIESIVLTTVGGIIGVILGLGLSITAVIAVTVLKPDWGVQFVFVPEALIIATGVAAAVGIIFGLYPAIKASRLDPIEALRYE